MAIAGLSVGHDASIVLYDKNSQTVIATANLTMFDEKAEMTEVKSRPLSGLPIYGYIPEGWKGTFELDRNGRAIDDFIAALETRYYAGGNVLTCVINRIVKEPDGSTSNYQYTGVAIKPSDAGSWKGDAKVSQKFDWAAATRINVS